MNRPLKIGFLMPYSGWYPFYGQHMMVGLTCALSKMNIPASQFNFVPAYVGNGSVQKCAEEAKKLIFFEGVDVLMGMVSIKVIEEIKPMLQSFNKLGIFFDFGEYIPYSETKGDNIFSISMNLWQSQYALGKWAINEFGSGGQMVMPIYEAGFNLSASFLEGASAVGANGLNSFVLPEKYANNNHLDLIPFFDALENQTPDFVHAIFAGKIGCEFLAQWRKSKFYNSIPLVVVENMGYNEALYDVQDLDIKMYTARSWQKNNEHKSNTDFVKRFESFGKQEANVFGMLGYEAGFSLSVMLQNLIKGDIPTALGQLNKSGVVGPRGIIKWNDLKDHHYTEIDIVKLSTNKLKINQAILASSNAFGFDTAEVIENTQSGWLNPYISI